MIRRIPLSQGQVALVNYRDYRRLMKHKWFAVRQRGGNFYAARSQWDSKEKRTRRVWMHREILRLGRGRLQQVDHIDGDTLNNCRRNMRRCTPGENSRNQKSQLRSSQYKCVCWNKRQHKWHARLGYRYQKIHLGFFDDEVEAAQAADRGMLKYHRGFARLNFPQQQQEQVS